MIRILFFLCLCAAATAFEIPQDCGQLILARAEHWESSSAELRKFEKINGRWKARGGRVPVRLGRNGLAWGLGLHPLPPGAVRKQEGDGKAPAGVFAIGHAYGYASSIRKHPALRYHQVTESDLWVEDPDSRYYNHHLRLQGRSPQTPWEEQAQMRLNDPAHALKLFIAHNAPPESVAGAGSAIFFHLWRENGARPTSGCTVMAPSELEALIAWIDPTLQPLYVLLPEPVYRQVRPEWGLP